MGSRRRRVEWSRRAYGALNEAVSYIADESSTAAERLLLRLLEAGSSLAELPDRGRVVPELSDPSIRELLIPPYRLIYEHNEEHVWIVALLHQKQEFQLRRDDL